MRRIILAAVFMAFTVGAHAADDNKKPAGATKGAAAGAVAGHEVGRRGCHRGRDRPSPVEEGRGVQVSVTQRFASAAVAG
jgi:hypothetical protein